MYSIDPLINKPPPLNRDYSRDLYIKALRWRGFINHGSTLGCEVRDSGLVQSSFSRV